MKKEYVSPATGIVNIKLQPVLESVSGSGLFNIGYGGVDTNSSMDPGSRRHNNLWDDEDEW